MSETHSMIPDNKMQIQCFSSKIRLHVHLLICAFVMQIRCGLTEIKFGKYSVAKNTGFIENSSVFNKTKTSSVFRCVRLLVESGLCASFYDAAKLECHVDITGCCNLPTTPSNGVLKLTQFEGQYYQQWVSNVIGYKNQWDNDKYSADQVKGPPNVYPAYGDKAGAWALNGVASDHYITIEYQKKIYIQSINIYETNKGGSAWRISFKGLNGNWLSVWEVDRATLSTVMTSSRIFSPTIQTVAFPANEVRIEIDTTNTDEDYEIDAIKITGQC